MIVYGIFFPNGKVYIGLTKRTLEQRMQQHLQYAFKYNSQYKVHRALRKYVPSTLVRQAIIAYGDSYNDLAEIEKAFVLSYDSYNNGYNETVGGLGWKGRKHKTETKEQFSKVRKLDASTRLINANLKLKELRKDPAYIAKIKEMRSKISKSVAEKTNITKKIKYSNRQYRESLGHKKFKVDKLDGTFVGIWGNQTLCAEDLNISRKNITRCLSRKAKTHKGYVFSWLTNGD